MASWTSLTFAALSALTSTKMTQLQANLTALAEGASGAPAIKQRMPPRDVTGSGSFVPATDCVIRWTPDGGTLTLPAASTFIAGQLIIVKKDGGATTGSIVRSGSDTIDGETAITIELPYETRRFIARTGGFDEI